MNWGISLAKAGRKSEAEEKFKKASSLSPTNPVILFLWGLLLFEQDKYTEAILRFNQSLLYAQDKYDSYYYLALCSLKQCNYKLAIKYSQEAITLDKTKVDAYIILADCYLKTCQDSLCLETFESADEIAQPNANFYTNWGLALQKYNFIDAAREKLYKALLINPTSEIVLFNLGMNFLMSSEYTQAEEFFNKVLEINPSNSMTLYNLAAISYNRQDYDKALEHYKSSYENDKKNYSIYFNIANCYTKKHDFENAKTYFKKCIEYCPKYIPAYLNYAKLLLDTGNYVEAQRKARTAYLMDKNDAYTNYAFGIVLLKSNELNDALDKFENAIKINPDYITAYLGKAETLLNMNNISESITIMESIMDKAFVIPEYQTLLIQILQEMIKDENLAQTTAETAYKCCNKFLQQYNNDKIVVVKNFLTEKYKFEAN